MIANGFGPGGWYGGGLATASIQTYLEGTLVVRKINKALDKLFSKYPPR